MHVGDVLVHVDGHPLAFVKNFGGVVLDIVDFFSEEEVEDTVGSLGEGCQTCQEVTVSKISLFDISGIRFINKYPSAFNFIRNFLPFDAIPFRQIPPLSTQRISAWWESIISKGLSFSSKFLNHFLSW